MRYRAIPRTAAALLSGLALTVINPSPLPFTAPANAQPVTSPAARTQPQGMQTVRLAVPFSNVDSSYAVGDSQVVSTVSDPLIAKLPKCVSCGDPPFKDFHVQFYVADLHWGSNSSVSSPRLLFTGPKGMQVSLYSARGGWVIYLLYDGQGGTFYDSWELHARQTATGKDVLLDSAKQENLPSMPQGASSDGRTVAWVSWTKGPNGGTCLILTYDLQTGVRRVVARGGSPNTWAWKYVSISGNRIAAHRDDYIGQHSRIEVRDLSTGKVTELTAANKLQSEPWISGDLVVWKNGSAGSQGTGVWVHNLKTGKRLLLPGWDTEFPHAFAGRYVAFPESKRSDDRYEAIRLYDTKTAIDRTLFVPNNGWGAGTRIMTGDHTVLFENGKSQPNGQNPLRRLTVTRLT